MFDLDGEPHSFFDQYLAGFLYKARIGTVMARSICDLGYSRLWMVEDLQIILFAKIISLS
jgi:hypothetical protein